MLINIHLKEIKYRFYYIIISLFLTYTIIFIYNDYVIFMFSPNIKTFMMYSNIIDNIILKWTVTLYISILFILPYLLFTIWCFIRPGLFKKEDINILFFPVFSLLPLFIYFCIIFSYNSYLIDFWLMKDNGLMERFIPTLLQIILLIKNIITFSLILTIIITVSFYFKLINIDIYKTYRLHILFLFLLLFTFFLPPDLIVLLFLTILLIILFELFFCFYLIKKNYLMFLLNNSSILVN